MTVPVGLSPKRPPQCLHHRRHRLPSSQQGQELPLQGPGVAEVLVIGAGEFIVTVTAANHKLMNGTFTPPARPELPVRPEMPDVHSLNLKCGMGIVALNNLECMLPDGVTHSYSINYMERAKEACLMVVHYRSELNVATQSGLAREVFDRFGVALDDDGSKFIMSLVKALPPPSSKKAVPMNGAQAREAAPKCPKTNSKKLFALLEQDTAVWSPSSLPDRRSWPIVPRHQPLDLRRPPCRGPL